MAAKGHLGGLFHDVGQHTLGGATEVPGGDWLLGLQPPGVPTPADALRRALLVALLAPSSHNTQPWRLRLRGAVVDVLADRSRRLVVVDPRDRELVMSCGALVGHLVLALANLGFEAAVALLPDPSQPDLLATVTVGRARAADADERVLFDQITRRHTNRRRFELRPVPPVVLDGLVADAGRAGCWLHVVRPGERHDLAGLVAAGDVIQAADPAFGVELGSWVDASRARSLDGMVPGVHGAPAKPGDGDAARLWWWRTFEAADGRAARGAAVVLDSPALVVLGAAEDDVASWLHCGMVLSTLLLRARSAGVWASFLNQAVEVPGIRRRLAEVIRAPGPPQLLLRLGYGADPGPTSRRPLAEVLVAP